MVYPFAGFFGRAGRYPTDPDEQALYVRYTLARWGAYWNLLLNVAGPEPLLRSKLTMTRDEVNRLGALIASMDVYGHPLSAHNPTGPDVFMEEAWPSYGILQGPKTVDVEELSDNGGPRVEDVGNSSSGFSGTLDLDDRRQWRHDIVKRVWDFLETIPFWTMRPRQDLVSAGRCLAREGERYLVYLPSDGAVDVAVERGPYRATWINARDTVDRRAAEAMDDGRRWVAPAEGDDWLLYIER